MLATMSAAKLQQCLEKRGSKSEAIFAEMDRRLYLCLVQIRLIGI